MRRGSTSCAFVCVAMSIVGCSARIDRALDEPEICDAFSDGDFGERPFSVVSFAVPSSIDAGFDIDDRRSKASDLDGCWYEDGRGGVDTAFTSMFAMLTTAFANAGYVLEDEIQRSVTAAQVVMTLRGWNGSRTDDCVNLLVTTARSTSNGTGRLRNGVLEVQGPMLVALLDQPPCGGTGDCPFAHGTTHALMWRARLVFAGGEDGMDRIVGAEGVDGETSLMGGYVEIAPFMSTMLAFAEGLPEESASAILSTASGYSDVDTNLRKGCSQLSATSTSADAFSIALIPTAVRADE